MAVYKSELEINAKQFDFEETGLESEMINHIFEQIKRLRLCYRNSVVV